MPETHELSPLSGAEIREALTGRYISNPGKKENKYIRFSEYFFENGEWLGIWWKMVQRQLKGRWLVENDRLCVQIGGGPVECREVWVTKDPSSIFILDLQLGDPMNKGPSETELRDIPADQAKGPK